MRRGEGGRVVGRGDTLKEKRGEGGVERRLLCLLDVGGLRLVEIAGAAVGVVV